MRVPPRVRRRGSAALLAIVSAASFSAVRCDSLSAEELACENAVSRLEDCCADFPEQSIRCVHETTECGLSYRGIPLDDARCLARMSCGELAAADACDRVKRAASSAATLGWPQGGTCP